MLPSRLHQVNENWIQLYRGWVYGGGFGLELGFGLSTIITTSLVHVMVITMVVIGSLPAALLIGVVFGLTRGLTVTVARHIETPDQLRTMFKTMAESQRRARYAGVVALVATGALGLTAIAW
jgi:cytochrome bd-type quinol oxidase subunit 2